MGPMADEVAVPPAKVAVIAVHGVSDQKPFDTVRTITNLLVATGRDAGGLGSARYTPFVESPLRIRVRPLELTDAPPVESYHELAQQAARPAAARRAAKAMAPDPTDVHVPDEPAD